MQIYSSCRHLVFSVHTSSSRFMGKEPMQMLMRICSRLSKMLKMSYSDGNRSVTNTAETAKGRLMAQACAKPSL